MEKNENMIKGIFCGIKDFESDELNIELDRYKYNYKIKILKRICDDILEYKFIPKTVYNLKNISAICLKFMTEFYLEEQRKEFYKFLDLNKDNENLLSKESFDIYIKVLKKNIKLTAELGKRLDDGVYTGSERERKMEDYKDNICLILKNCVFLLYLINLKVV